MRFSKIRAYLTYSLVFEDEHVRSGVVHVVFQSQTLEQLGVFENVRVINDLYIFEEHLNESLIYQTMARMIYRTLRVIQEYLIRINTEKQAGF